MNTMQSESFVFIVIAFVAVIPAAAYLALRVFGAHQAAADHPVTHTHHD